MLILVVLLVLTNVVTAGVLVRVLLRPRDVPAPDPVAAAALTRATGARRLISIEILNPLELAAARGWLGGVAGSIAPGLTRRIVHDQTIRIVRQQLAEQQVVADVRLHALPAPGGTIDL